MIDSHRVEVSYFGGTPQASGAPRRISVKIMRRQNGMANSNDSGGPSEGGSAADVDIATFQALSESLGADSAVVLVDLFRTDSARLVDAAEAAITARDLPALRQATHTLKSGSSMLGALNLAALCQRLEQQARAGELRDPDRDRAELRRLYGRASAALAAAAETRP